MNCSKKTDNSNLLDLEADLPVTAEDSKRLKALDFRPELTFEEYIDFLEAIEAFAARKSDPIVFEDIFTL
jgi:hypothetical protein